MWLLGKPRAHVAKAATRTQRDDTTTCRTTITSSDEKSDLDVQQRLKQWMYMAYEFDFRKKHQKCKAPLADVGSEKDLEDMCIHECPSADEAKTM